MKGIKQIVKLTEDINNQVRTLICGSPAASAAFGLIECYSNEIRKLATEVKNTELATFKEKQENLEDTVKDLVAEVFSLKSHSLSAKVLEVINAEIEYQNAKWGEQHNRSQTVEGHLIILRKELEEAYEGWMKNSKGRNSVESELVQVAAVAIQALINLDNAGRL